MPQVNHWEKKKQEFDERRREVKENCDRGKSIFK